MEEGKLGHASAAIASHGWRHSRFRYRSTVKFDGFPQERLVGPIMKSPENGNLRFLLVEDDADYAMFLREMVLAFFSGAHVDTVSGSADAIERLPTGSYDLCFVDYVLGNSTGLDVLAAVNAANLTTAFILLTAHTRQDIALEALQLGASDYLNKDGLNRFELERCITYALYRRHKEVELAQTALRDPLTGLGNRALFHEQAHLFAAQARREKTRFAIVYIDIDGFKPVNDTLGHHIGDELLKQIAQRIVNRVRDSDVVARMGGDEFIVILSRIRDWNAALTVAKELTSAMESPFVVDDESIEIGASVGIALFPEDAENIDDLIRVADTRMYEHKAKFGQIRAIRA